MQDYKNLVEALRHCVSDEKGVTKCAGCPYYPDITGCMDRLHTDAADAIDALQAEVDTLKRTDSKRCQECLYLGQPIGEQQLPKQGKWVTKYDGFEFDVRCSICGEEALIKEGGSHDYKYSNYCPNCGAKMEVQDAEEN